MKPTFGFAIPCFNEAQNLSDLLPILDRIKIGDRAARRFAVVSDASRDGTDEIVLEFAKKTGTPVELMTNEKRIGKARAVNRCIRALRDVDVIVLVSADVRPQEGCIRRLVEAFEDDSVGVAGGRVVPFGIEGNVAFEVTRLLWNLHHVIATRFPKTTEITAFRNRVDHIDETSLVDEAELEARLNKKGLVTRYIPEALIFSPSPLRLADYFKRRAAITLGYLRLRRNHRHFVATQSIRERARAIRELRRTSRISVGTIVLAIVMETLVLGWARAQFVTGFGKSGIWARSESTKRALAQEQLVPL